MSFEVWRTRENEEMWTKTFFHCENSPIFEVFVAIDLLGPKESILSAAQ